MALFGGGGRVVGGECVGKERPNQVECKDMFLRTENEWVRPVRMINWSFGYNLGRRGARGADRRRERE